MNIDDHVSLRGKRVLITRALQWDSTQAGPRIAYALRDAGAIVTFLSWEAGAPSSEQINGITVLRWQFPRMTGVKYFLCWPLWWTRVIWQMISGRYEIIHAMDLQCGIPAILGRVITRNIVIYDIRDAWGMVLTSYPFPIPQLFTWVDRLVSGRVNGLLLSQGALRACAHYHGKRAAKRTPVIQVLNVPGEDWGTSGFTIPGKNTPPVLNCCGRLSRHRGIIELIEATKLAGWTMDVFGKINDEQLKEALESTEHVVFSERISHSDSIQRLDKSDVVSMWYSSNMYIIYLASSNKMFEAMMMGKPYICTKDSFPGIVADMYGLGWGIPYGDVETCRILLEDLAHNPEKIVEAGKRGRKAYESEFGWERQKENMLSLYRHVLGDTTVIVFPRNGWSRFIGTCIDTPQDWELRVEKLLRK